MVYCVVLKCKSFLAKDTPCEVLCPISSWTCLEESSWWITVMATEQWVYFFFFFPLNHGEAVYCVEWSFSHLIFNYFYCSTRWKMWLFANEPLWYTGLATLGWEMCRLFLKKSLLLNWKKKTQNKEKPPQQNWHVYLFTCETMQRPKAPSLHQSRAQ